MQGLKKGDRVAYLSPRSYAEYTAVQENQVTKIGDGISFEVAAASILQGMTAFMLTKEATVVKPHDFVLIHAAAGGMGQWLCQVCSQLGAKVIGTVSSEEKAKEAKKCGAHSIINYSTEDVAERVKEITEGKGVNVVIDGVGQSTFDASLNSLARRGVFLSYGNASGKVPPLDILRLSKNCIQLQRPTLFEYIQTKEEFQKRT